MSLDKERVVTAKLPEALALKLDDVAERIERPKRWIIRHALAEWLVEEQRRPVFSLEALRGVDEGRTVSHDDVLARVAQKKSQARERG